MLCIQTISGQHADGSGCRFQEPGAHLATSAGVLEVRGTLVELNARVGLRPRAGRILGAGRKAVDHVCQVPRDLEPALQCSARKFVPHNSADVQSSGGRPAAVATQPTASATASPLHTPSRAAL